MLFSTLTADLGHENVLELLCCTTFLQFLIKIEFNSTQLYFTFMKFLVVTMLVCQRKYLVIKILYLPFYLG